MSNVGTEKIFFDKSLICSDEFHSWDTVYDVDWKAFLKPQSINKYQVSTLQFQTLSKRPPEGRKVESFGAVGFNATVF